VVLPASGCEMIAKVRRREISSVRVLIRLRQLLRGRDRPQGDQVTPDMMAAREFANRRILRLLQPEEEKLIADFADNCSASTAELPVGLHLSSRSHQSPTERMDQKCAVRMAQRSIWRGQQRAAACGPAPSMPL
jgi:hypothetical protein